MNSGDLNSRENNEICFPLFHCFRLFAPSLLIFLILNYKLWLTVSNIFKKDYFS